MHRLQNFVFTDEFRSKVACENERIQLKCNPNSRVAVYSASYGRTEYESIQCPQPQGVPEESTFLLVNIHFEDLFWNLKLLLSRNSVVLFIHSLVKEFVFFSLVCSRNSNEVVPYYVFILLSVKIHLM